MRMIVTQRTVGAMAAALLTAWTVSVTAGETGVVRIADRSGPAVVRVTDQVVRGQSPVDVTDSRVQQTSLLCPSSLECTDPCATGSCHISGGCPCQTYACPSYECQTYECPTYECQPAHGCPLCPLCPFSQGCGCGHQCPIVAHMIDALCFCHEIKADLWKALGLPTHCCCCCRRGKCRRERELHCRAQRECRRQRLGQWLTHTKLNYFFIKNPPCGHYTLVYPVNPWYGDARDAGVYGAEGYGGPMSVPLAPVIRHTFNYGWGVPSSRLTPISHLAAAPYNGYGPPAQYGAYPYYANAGQQPGQAPMQTAAQPGPATY